jgi:hypothetical protein
LLPLKFQHRMQKVLSSSKAKQLQGWINCRN